MKTFNSLFAIALIATSTLFFSCQKDDPFVNTPPSIEDQQFSVNENSPNGTLVDTVKATDSDKNQTLKYYIISGNFNNAFKIDSLTGVILVNNSLALDFEKVKVFELGIKVRDDYKDNLSASARVTIVINNIYENQAPIINNQDFSIDENKPNNTYVGTIQATDKDLGQTLSFSIIAGNTDAAFRIEPNTGKLFVNNISALNYEVNQSFALQVKVSDNYTSSLSDTAIITVKIQDIEEISMPQNGLVAYYPFNGNAKDESGNSHNGTVYGATLTTDRHHKANSAYEFNGINNYINTFSTFNYEYRTISFWVNPYDIRKTGLERNIALVQDSYENSYGSIIVFFGDNSLSMNAGGTVPANQYYTSNVVENRWYHIVLVRNGAQTLYYINGDLVSTGVSGTVGSTSNPNPFLIFGSGRTTTVNFFSGKIDEIAIYNRALSANEINTIYGVK